MSTTMNAFVYKQFGDHHEVLTKTSVDRPSDILPRDILVQNKAVSVNPVDVKRITGKFGGSISAPVIVGNDAAGIVVEVGTEVKNFKIGDEVFYAGAINRPGTFAEYTLVDERIVGKKPTTLTWSQAAGAPLVVLTAFEGLFENLGLRKGAEEGRGKSLLVINGAGGVGSIVIQAAKKLTGLTVIATASRPETVEFCKRLGADYVINHREALLPQIQQLNLTSGLIDYVYNAHTADDYFALLPDVLNPRGNVVFITEAAEKQDITLYMSKRITFSYELMFSRTLFQYDLEKQGEILNNFADLVDRGELVHTVTETFEVDQLHKALDILKSGRAIGKTSLNW